MTKKPRCKPLRFLVTGALLIGPAIQGCDLFDEGPGIEAPEPVGMEAPEPGVEELDPGIEAPAPEIEAREPIVEVPRPGVAAPDPGMEVQDPGVEGIAFPMRTNVVAPNGRRQHRPGYPY